MQIVSDINSAYKISELGNASIKIGGDTVDFNPEIRASWECSSGEEQFWMKLNRIVPIVDEKETLVDEKLSFKVGDNTDIWYIKDGQFKWDIEFDKKPLTNVFEWELEYPSGLRFSYQDSLENEYIENEENGTLSEFLAANKRPENVIGSYAVFCDKEGRRKDQEGNTLVNYKTGKLMHIYRPLCIDNNDKKVWAELYINKDTLRITIPQEFLNNAAYPVTLDPDFGITAVGGTAYSTAYNIANGSFTTTTEIGAVTSMSLYWENTNATFNRGMAVDVFSDASGPNVSQGGETKGVLKGIDWDNWEEIDVSGWSFSLVGSTSYWFAWQAYSGDWAPATSGVEWQYDTDVAYNYYYRNRDDPWGGEWSLSGQTRKFSVFVTYTETAPPDFIPQIIMF